MRNLIQRTLLGAARRAGQSGPAPRPSRALSPTLEVCETRELLTFGLLDTINIGTTGFISGSVVLESTGKGQAGAIIEVFKPTANSPIATAVTDAYGNYTVTGLAPGDYYVRQTAPAGTTNSFSDSRSTVNPASSVAIDTIQVRVVDPRSVYANTSGASDGAFAAVQNAKGLFSSVTVRAGAYDTTVGTSVGADDLAPAFRSFTVGTAQQIDPSADESRQVKAIPISQLKVGLFTISADRAGRAAYLVNRYSTAPLDKVTGAAVQLAIWELLYDSGSSANFGSGNYVAKRPGSGTTDAEYAQILTRATAFFNESAGKRETATVLDASKGDILSSSRTASSVIIPNALNFVNKTAFNVDPTDRVNLEITDVRYFVNGYDVGPTLAGNFKGGDVVEVEFTIPKGEGRFTLAAYSADDQFNVGTQRLAASQTLYLTAGRRRLKVATPSSNVEVYFVHGKVINTFNIDKGIDYFSTNQFISSAIGFGPGTPGYS